MLMGVIRIEGWISVFRVLRGNGGEMGGGGGVS